MELTPAARTCKLTELTAKQQELTQRISDLTDRWAYLEELAEAEAANRKEVYVRKKNVVRLRRLLDVMIPILITYRRPLWQ